MVKCSPNSGSISENPDGRFRNEENDTGGSKESSGKKRLARQKREEALRKYKYAVYLYANTDMTMRLIAKVCHVSEGGLRTHLHRWHRHLVLARYGIVLEGERPEAIKLGSKKGQRDSTRKKYGKAVEACGKIENIRFSISAIAREFKLNETGLGNQLRMYYPEILQWREQTKQRLGIADNCHRGAKRETVEQYAPAVEMYRTSNRTIPEVAEECHVSPHGLREHLRNYHRRLLEKKEAEREQAKKRRKKGTLSGNGRIRGPKPETVEKYKNALELYRNTVLDSKEIARRTGVTISGFRGYIREWHRDLMLERRGGSCSGDEDWIDLSRTKRCSPSAANKYAEAIARLKTGGRTTASVAAEYGFNPETFRDYLHKHEPELAKRLGMMRNRYGRLVSRKSEEKYRDAILLYETSDDSLKSIAERLGLVYISLGNYVRRNYPELIAEHNERIMNKKTNDENEI